MQKAQDLTMSVFDPGGRHLISHSPSDSDRVPLYHLMNNSNTLMSVASSKRSE